MTRFCGMIEQVKKRYYLEGCDFSIVSSHEGERNQIVVVSRNGEKQYVIRSSVLGDFTETDYLGELTPFSRLHEYFKYGKYATNTAMDGFDSTDAAVMIVHSADDDVIGIEYGLDKYYEKYKDNPRFTFMRFEDRGHNGIFNDPGNTYIDEFNAQFDSWRETLDYDYNAEENKERFIEEKANYITENLDHERWSHRLDEDLFAQFLEFYDQQVR